MKRRFIILGTIAVIVLFVLIIIFSKTIKEQSNSITSQNDEQSKQKEEIIELNNVINELNILNKELEDANKLYSIKVEETKTQLSELDNNQELPEIDNFIYFGPSDSGLRIYKGTEGIYSYPIRESKIVFPYEEMDVDFNIVNCIATVTAGSKETWGVVVANNFGDVKIGYVPYDELERYYPEKYLSMESIGNIHLGDRIESMIGELDRDYYILSDNICVYHFPRYIYGVNMPEGENHSYEFDAFVGNDLHIFNLRTNIEEFKLKSGYGVGDNAKLALKSYGEFDISYDEGPVLYKIMVTISYNEYLTIVLDGKEFTENSIIYSIELSKKY